MLSDAYSVVTLSVTHAECVIYLIVMLNVITPSVAMLSVVMLSVI